jgi:hypothetical protein
MTADQELYAWANPDKSITVRATDGKTEFSIDIQAAEHLKENLLVAIRAAKDIHPSAGSHKRSD